MLGDLGLLLFWITASFDVPTPTQQIQKKSKTTYPTVSPQLDFRCTMEPETGEIVTGVGQATGPRSGFVDKKTKTKDLIGVPNNAIVMLW